MNIRKVLAGSLATITVGATLVMAGFGAGIADYVQTSDATLTSPIYVVGDDAKSPDTLALTDIATAFAGYATKTASVGGTATTSVSGGVAIDSDLNKTYKDKTWSTVKSSVISTDLPTLLATQEFTDNNATTISYQQLIELGPQTVAYGKPSDFTEPTLYAMFGGSAKYALKVIFLGGLDTASLDSSLSLTLFGKEYTFSAGTQNTAQLELFSSSGAKTLTLSGYGDEESVTIEGDTYKITLNGWSSDGTKAYLLINGAATSPAGWGVGYHTISGTTTKLYVKDVSVVYTGAQEAQGQVTLFVGADKLKLVNNTAVERNDEALVNTKITFDSSGTKINALTFDIAPDIDTYVADGGEFVDPLFGSFKFKINDMTPAMKTGRDVIKFGKDGTNKVKTTFTNKAGTEYAVTMFYCDTGAGDTWEATTDGSHEFWTTEANSTDGLNNITTGDYFVLTSGYNTYVYKFASYYPNTDSSKRYVTLTDASTGVAQKIYLETSDPYLRVGTDKFKVNWTGGDYGTGYSIMVDLNGDAVWDKTAVNIMTATGGAIAPSLGTIPQFLVVETPLYTVSGNDVGLNAVINVTATYSGTNYVGFSENVTSYQIGTTNTYTGLTVYGTYAERDTDSDTVTLYYPGPRPAYANVAVGTDPSFTTAGGAVEVEQVVKITEPVGKLASEVTTSTLSSDIVLVGGPCANTLVKTLLDTEWNETDSCAAWSTHVTGIGIIKEITDAFGSGKKALIVAGDTAADTRSLGAKVMKGTLSF